MQKISKVILFSGFLFLPHVLQAWGDGTRLHNGACKFDKETGYSALSLYIKGDESYVIVDVKDRRYGTTSTVFNAKTCEKITSGDKKESEFESLMVEKGFIYTPLNYRYNIDKSFQNKIYFSQNSDNLIVKVAKIESSITTELKTLLSSLSDKSASSNISLSRSAKVFLKYKQFYDLFLEKLNSLSPMDINYKYALSLNDKFNIESRYTEKSKKIILAKQEEKQKILLAKEEASKKRVATNNSYSSNSGYDDGRDEVAALGILLGGALLYKGAQVIGELLSSTSSSSSSSYSSSSSSSGSRYITDFGIEAPRSGWDRNTVWYRVSIKINDGSLIWAHVQRNNGCYELGVGSVDSNIYGNCTNCFDNINEYWSCHANGGGNFNIQGDQVEATKAIVERSR